MPRGFTLRNPYKVHRKPCSRLSPAVAVMSDPQRTLVTDDTIMSEEASSLKPGQKFPTPTPGNGE